MTLTEATALPMGELVEKLQANEEAQRVLYETYLKAADMDDAMRALKEDEKKIRYGMQVKLR